MPHDVTLITTLAVAFVLASVFGYLANRLRPPMVGYLVAGVMIAPSIPGFVADEAVAGQLAEIGVIPLMFGVGLHLSLKDLLSVRRHRGAGADRPDRARDATGGGMAGLGWSVGAGLVFGLALSVASTVVLLKALQERRLVESERGRIAVGWLIVEDIVMVLTLVLLPPLAGMLGGVSPTDPEDIRLIVWLGMGPIWGTLAITAFKIAAFVTLMLVVGRKVVPWILHHVAHSGSRELFRLSVLAVALGVAFGASSLFGVSFALGAFFAGMVMAESPLSTQATRDTLPLRDAFAVLFFVSVGMLFDPVVVGGAVTVLARRRDHHRRQYAGRDRRWSRASAARCNDRAHRGGEHCRRSASSPSSSRALAWRWPAAGRRPDADPRPARSSRLR